MSIRRRKLDSQSIEAQIAESRAEQAAAHAAKDEAQSRTGRIESIVSYLEERRRVNGFGKDFEITTLRPRKSS